MRLGPLAFDNVWALNYAHTIIPIYIYTAKTNKQQSGLSWLQTS